MDSPELHKKKKKKKSKKLIYYSSPGNGILNLDFGKRSTPGLLLTWAAPLTPHPLTPSPSHPLTLSPPHPLPPFPPSPLPHFPFPSGSVVRGGKIYSTVVSSAEPEQDPATHFPPSRSHTTVAAAIFTPNLHLRHRVGWGRSLGGAGPGRIGPKRTYSTI